MYEMWLKAPHTLSIQKVIKDLCNSPKVLGQHYFVDNPEKSKKDAPAIVPKFDFTSASQKGHAEAFFIGAKEKDVSVDKADVDWLSLKSTKGHLADHVFRVDTKAGQPPASVSIL